MKRLLVVLTLGLVIAAGTSGWWWLRGSLPVLDGQLSVAGLNSPVEVLFDDYGVPHVYATSPETAWFTAGVLHARDRRWQMELYRRVTAGRLSEVLGAATISFDRRFLTLGLRDAAQAEWDRATTEVRAALEAYAAGVNAATSQMTGRRRPIEFQLLGITPPTWTPIDSLAVGRLLTWRLAENHQAELVRGALRDKFSETVVRQLTGVAAASFQPSASGSQPSASQLKAESRKPTADSPSTPLRASRRPIAGLEWLAAGARRGNSNSWVLAGGRTKSGRPILANDPHLQIEFPSVWYELHLVSAGLDVIGVTIPGVPFVAIGHNARIAWGLTATFADVQDLAIERVDVGRKRVMSRGAWVPIETVTASIPVRGRGQPIPFEVWKTRNGPIFADVDLDWEDPPTWLSPDDRPAEERRAYSIRWDTSDDVAATFDAINRARDWPTFTSALGTFTAPSMNVVYADVDGNTGYALAGRLPIRAAGDGTIPVDGSSTGGWTGAIDPATLPRAFNPATGMILTANNEVDPSFRGLISRDWAAPFRATRLSDQLRSSDADLASTAALQNDRHSVAAGRVLAGLESAIKAGRAREDQSSGVRLLEELKSWDRVVDARPVVALYEAFEHHLWRRTFVDEMDEPLFLKFYEWAGAERPAGLYTILADPGSAWWDDISTVERKESRDDMFLLAVRDADEQLRNDFGSGAGRRWDRVHAARFSHALGGVAFPFRWLFDRGPVPVEGDGTTVMRVSWNRLTPFAAWEHPSWRQILDVGRWDDSRVALPTGQSGHPMSPYYFDQNETWRAGQYRPQPFSRSAVVAAAKHRLLLVP